ncbi:MAG: hypothetical protein LQ342_005729 [Letrouitia transgressa]|nr:MAG: hypothetical protein LQ342_005729 [Letrouitia transgressa]
MGSSSSKAAKSAAATATRRRYPQRHPENNPATNHPPRPTAASSSGPTVHPKPHASEIRDDSINLDASDPQFARSLRSLGPVQPSSTLSNSSTFQPSGAPSSASSTDPQVFPNPAMNPALQILRRREVLASEAEAEFSRQRAGGGGRRFLDAVRIREILVSRDQKRMTAEEIEKDMGLAPGVVEKLGPKGVVGDVGAQGV